MPCNRANGALSRKAYPMTPERNVLSWIWLIFMVGFVVLFGVFIVRDIATSEDSTRAARLACLGLVGGVGVVHLTTLALDYLYRRRPRVWLAIAPSPMTVLVVASVFFLVAVAPLRGSLGLAYLIGAALWLQWVTSMFERDQEEDLRRLLRDPSEDE